MPFGDFCSFVGILMTSTSSHTGVRYCRRRSQFVAIQESQRKPGCLLLSSCVLIFSSRTPCSRTTAVHQSTGQVRANFPLFSGRERAHGTTVIDKRNCMLISRIACLGKIQHQKKPYSGPLSRHLLAYQSIISRVRNTLRDLVEMILAAMFLEGSVQRERTDWIDLSIR